MPQFFCDPALEVQYRIAAVPRSSSVVAAECAACETTAAAAAVVVVADAASLGLLERTARVVFCQIDKPAAFPNARVSPNLICSVAEVVAVTVEAVRMLPAISHRRFAVHVAVLVTVLGLLNPPVVALSAVVRKGVACCRLRRRHLAACPCQGLPDAVPTHERVDRLECCWSGDSRSLAAAAAG